eukprot:scaffold35950_cov19-Tisochrysis_lutea.AAC.1
MNATHDAFCGVNAFQGCRWVIAADWTPCAYALPDPNGFQFFSFPRNSEMFYLDALFVCKPYVSWTCMVPIECSHSSTKPWILCAAAMHCLHPQKRKGKEREGCTSQAAPCIKGSSLTSKLARFPPKHPPTRHPHPVSFG